MKDPERLLSSRDASAHERALLEAGVAEEPPADGAARLAVALGLPTVGTLVSPSVAEAAVGTAKAAAGAAGASKWIAVVAGVIAIAGSSYLVYQRATPSQRKPTPPVESETSPIEQTVRSADERAAVLPPATREVAPSASIAEEISLLERVRHALKRGDGESAQRELSAYEQSFSRGALREEAEFLRIETSATLGDKERARGLGQSFLRAHPSSVHEARVRALLESLNGG